MHILAAWEGRVLEVTRTHIVAVVEDQLDRNTPEEEAVIPLDQISDSDRDLVVPGALFQWAIGYHTQASGKHSGESVISFHRLPKWATEEVESARNHVKEAAAAIVASTRHLE